MRETKREFRDRHNRAQTHWDDLVDWLWMAQEDAAGLRSRVAELEADLKESTERGDIYKKSFYQAQQRAEAAERILKGGGDE